MGGMAMGIYLNPDNEGFLKAVPDPRKEAGRDRLSGTCCHCGYPQRLWGTVFGGGDNPCRCVGADLCQNEAKVYHSGR